MLDWNRKIIEEFRANKGEVSTFARQPLLLLTHIGAKTGKQRTNPLAYFRDGERYVVVASKGGAPEHPAWYYNLRANPSFEIEALVDGEVVTVPVTATEIVGDAWQEAYGAIAAEEPQFGGYLEKTDRRIPVFQLTARTR